MATQTKFASLAHEQADRLLAALDRVQDKLARRQAAAEAALEQLRAEWRFKLEPTESLIRALDRNIKELAQEHRLLFFGEAPSVKVALPHGALLYERSDYVVHKRGVTPAALEKAGFPEAVRVARSVDWDLLATWPDERLALIGTERKARETFGYEVKDGNQGAAE